MSDKEIRQRLLEAEEEIRVSLQAGRIMRTFGRMLMPSQNNKDEQIEAVHKSEIAEVFEFFGDLIARGAERASSIIDGGEASFLNLDEVEAIRAASRDRSLSEVA
ncbi:MAG: hypothetical protein PHW25_01030 [Zoogloea sp.]|uniref:hypothetical protein n=1 Tax=Zoogloea sp. TaxID=49181 RepID=UPI00260A613A|nr:hypothetical protein [Zoogloea sp.]MDD3325650.1 hypothetical protein [Zoogloea sp.]